MQTFLTIAIIIVCVLLILVVLIQNSKGGGISSNFTAANQIMGARRGTDVVEKTTWALAIVLLVLCLLSSPKTGTATTDENAGVSKSKSGGSYVPPTQQPTPTSAQPVAPAGEPTK